MTMPTFEPAVLVDDRCTERLNWYSKFEQVLPDGTKLHPADQLQQAYEAGKRDAVPEGYVIVPVDPEGQWSNPDLINIMVDAFNDTEGGKYDSMLAAYKAMFAAAPKGEKE